jgi:Domain of unknown function (DUF222)
MAEDAAACAAGNGWALSDDDVLACLAQVHGLEQRLAAVRLGLVRELDGRGLAVKQGAAGSAVWLWERLHVTIPVARRWVQLARDLDRPALVPVAAALAAGAVTVEQVQVIAGAVRELPAEVGPQVVGQAAAALLAAAGQFDPWPLRRLAGRILALVAPEVAEQADLKALQRQDRDAQLRRGFTMTGDGTGGVFLRGRLDAEAAAVVTAALDPLSAPGALLPSGMLDERMAEARRADALVEVCRLALAGGQLPANGGDRPQLVVTVGYHPLRRELAAGSLDGGGRLTPETVRRLACDAHILPALLDGAGVPLDVGRGRRTIGGPLRRALVLRDQGCAFPGCDRPPRWCDGHHIRHWADGGPTCLHNAVLLCGRHHQLIHHDDWAVRIAADGLPEFLPPARIDPHRRPRRNLLHRRN